MRGHTLMPAAVGLRELGVSVNNIRPRLPAGIRYVRGLRPPRPCLGPSVWSSSA